MGRFVQHHTNLFEFTAGLLYFTKTVFQDIIELFHLNQDQRKLKNITIEPINICNANCVFCPAHTRKGKFYKEIELPMVEKILHSFCAAGGGNVCLTPMNGEPLLNSNLEQIVAMCRSHEKVKCINVSTNGILLTRERFVRLRDAGVSEIAISMTYPEENEYEELYRSKQFHRLMNNVHELMLLDRKNVAIILNIKTRKRLFWKAYPLFKRAKSLGFRVSRSFYLDDWSIRAVADNLKEFGLFRRPLRGRHLPCKILQTGPYLFSSGRLTTCGCRGLTEDNELANEKIFYPFYESGDLNKVYYETIEPLRKRFLHGKPPSICAICRLYSPEFQFTSTIDQFAQVFADVKAGIGFLLRLRT